MKCKFCKEEMPAGREEFYELCQYCAQTKPYVAFNVFPHKTGSDVQIIDTNLAGSSEALRIANRANKRSR
jgi:hypothetical protein